MEWSHVRLFIPHLRGVAPFSSFWGIVLPHASSYFITVYFLYDVPLITMTMNERTRLQQRATDAGNDAGEVVWETWHIIYEVRRRETFQQILEALKKSLA